MKVDEDAQNLKVLPVSRLQYSAAGSAPYQVWDLRSGKGTGCTVKRRVLSVSAWQLFVVRQCLWKEAAMPAFLDKVHVTWKYISTDPQQVIIRGICIFLTSVWGKKKVKRTTWSPQMPLLYEPLQAVTREPDYVVWLTCILIFQVQTWWRHIKVLFVFFSLFCLFVNLRDSSFSFSFVFIHCVHHTPATGEYVFFTEKEEIQVSSALHTRWADSSTFCQRSAFLQGQAPWWWGLCHHIVQVLRSTSLLHTLLHAVLTLTDIKCHPTFIADFNLLCDKSAVFVVGFEIREGLGCIVAAVKQAFASFRSSCVNPLYLLGKFLQLHPAVVTEYTGCEWGFSCWEM